jgi:hypothetical protein
VVDQSLAVLHALRLKGFAEPAVLAGATGFDDDVVTGALAGLADEELVVRREGRVSGWSLSPAGREEHRRRIEAELEEADTRAEVDGCYRRFLALNGELLALCTAWQMREGPGVEPVLNDHRDAAYDAAIVERLGRVHQAVLPVCDDLAGALPRYRPYRPRLDAAHRRVRAGEAEWLTRPLIDSYHTVWFELHEDLLVTLGIERKEGET